MLAKLAAPMLDIVGKVADHFVDLGKAAAAGDQSSLVRVSSVARVEPITLVDMRAQSLPYTHDVMQSLNSIFAGYYLQAVSLMMPVGRVNVIKALDRLSPERQGFLKQIDAKFSASVESFKLPDFTKQDLGLEAVFKQKPSEVIKKATDGEEHALKIEEKDDEPSRGFGVKNSKDLNSVIMESVNLSVGKLLEVTVKDGEAKANIPVAIRLLATVLDPKTLVHILSDNSRNTGFKERWHGWRSGELKFWKDLIFCQDLIDEHRRALMKDSSNIHSDMMARSRKNTRAALISGVPSAGNASNLAVITSETAGELERQIGGRLRDFKTRQRIFESTYLMILTVIDPEWEHVTFYHNGISTPTTMSVGELKTANKGTGPDVMEILKAYMMGSAPRV